MLLKWGIGKKGFHLKPPKTKPMNNSLLKELTLKTKREENRKKKVKIKLSVVTF